MSENIRLTDGGLAELLICNLVGDVGAHQDAHGDAQLLLDHVGDELQAVGPLVHTLEEEEQQQWVTSLWYLGQTALHSWARGCFNVATGHLSSALQHELASRCSPNSERTAVILQRRTQRLTLMREIPIASFFILPLMVSHTLPTNWCGMTNTKMSASLEASTTSGTAS